ncbi:DUF4142 domain-containing protein [Sphingobium sp.]|uniref:DUF4142 domain-containing protein n=1 Tax=Sphingobium sp. TaxID=1912891 RepID=UPI002C45A9BE|nr:DUF4142 domain-containing protein [Sphingobium sp.]HUD91068.1 DUF4142 domain-containing protein [Sphingobium sp.]
MHARSGKANSCAMGWAALLCLSACSQTGGGEGEGLPANGSATVAKHYEGPKPEGVSSPNDAVTTTFYIPQAAIGDMYEIEAGELAMVRAHAPDVKAFARQMVTDHKSTSAQLRRFVADNPVNIAIPRNMDPRRSAMLGNLRGAGDREFDSVYIGQQAAAHLEAYNLHASYARRGDYPALKRLAEQTMGIITQHRKHIEALDQSLGPTSQRVPAGQ